MSYENLLEKFKNLENAINEFNSNKVDMDSIESVKEALAKLKAIHNDLNEIVEETPLTKYIFDMFFGNSISSALDEQEKYYENQLNKLLEERECSCTKRKEFDKTVCNCENDDFCNKHDFIRDVTPEDVKYVVSNKVISTMKSNSAMQSQLAEIIASYYNNSVTCPEVFGDDKEFRYVTNILFSFADYVLNK